MNSKRTLALLFILATAPALALAQEGGGGSGSGGSGGSGGGGHGESGGGCGDVLGDLIHILRDSRTGQPILQKRTIEVQGVAGTGYCPIPIDEDGNEIGFLPDSYSCDPADPDAVVEVDYFGRLSGGRTKERNSRMHFDEVISSIKDAGWVGKDETGRLQLGYECTTDGDGKVLGCEELRVIDSPMENLALYSRIMKYGHFQTHPEEIDNWSHGSSAAGPQFHPALDMHDYAKFDRSMRHLLPRGEDDASPEATCFGSVFLPACAEPDRVKNRDFMSAAAFLAGAANKTGKITVDLVQYMNRILKVTLNTEMSKVSEVNLLPALVRDCEGFNDEPDPTVGGNCRIYEAHGLQAPANELFINFGGSGYNRAATYTNVELSLLRDEGYGTWSEEVIGLGTWLDTSNAGRDKGRFIDGFIKAASDSLRAIEFVHNYAIPEDLWSLYAE